MTLFFRGFSRHKKMILCAAILLFIAGGVFLNTELAVAAPNITNSFTGAASSFTTKAGEAAAGVWIAYGLLYVAFLGLSNILSAVGFMLDNLFHFNLAWNLVSKSLLSLEKFVTCCTFFRFLAPPSESPGPWTPGAGGFCVTR